MDWVIEQNKTSEEAEFKEIVMEHLALLTRRSELVLSVPLHFSLFSDIF